MSGISVLINGSPERTFVPSCMRINEKAAYSPEGGSAQKLTRLHPLLGLSSLWNCEKEISVVYKLPSLWSIRSSSPQGAKTAVL